MALTALLAFSAIRFARSYERLQRERVEELEAFAGRVAHDLRGPLSPATMAFELLQRSLTDDDHRRRTLERGQRSLRHLDSLISDLLAFARAGASPDPGASAGLREVAANVVHDLEPQAQENGVHIVWDDLPSSTLACAPGVLASVLLNLLGNSVKYMPSDAANKVVRLRAARTTQRLRIEVSDTGRGLPTGDPRHLFEPYVRGSKSTPGIGLGLATVRRLVEAHGGSVGAYDKQGSGAVFWVEMPERRG
jgi:signal transduction histidine kinase